MINEEEIKVNQYEGLLLTAIIIMGICVIGFIILSIIF